MNGFVNHGNWFSQKYQVRSDCRFHTFKAALNLLHQLPHVGGAPRVIVETGCARMPNDWGGGQSTLLFADYLQTNGGHLHSVDISETSCAWARDIVAAYTDNVTVTCKDSVKFLSDWSKHEGFQHIDLLYLDSFDYPYGELLNVYGGQRDIEAATKTLDAMLEEDIVKKHGDIILACQNHCVEELKAAMPAMRQDGIILIDDNSLAGGGKPRLAKRLLRQLGWTCVLDYQQTLWIKR